MTTSASADYVGADDHAALAPATVTAHIIRGDARCLPLADGSVDLIVTSPPYFALRSYQDGGEHYAGQIGAEPTPAEFVDALIACTREWMRVLKPSGSIWVNLGDKYAQPGKGERNGQGIGGTIVHKAGANTANRSARDFDYNGVRGKSLIGIPWRYALRCVDELGLILRAEVIWSKPNGLPESITDRVRRSHEQWFHLTREPRYFSSVDEIREDYASEYARSLARGTGRKASTDHPAATTKFQQGFTEFNGWTGNPLGKLPGSVWTVPSEPLNVPQALGVDHFAAFPSEWPRRIIQGWSPPHGVVLDPFGGTGTTALVASVLGRLGVTVDLSSDYCRLARWRTTDPGERARAMRVEKPPKQLDGQFDLFGAAS